MSGTGPDEERDERSHQDWRSRRETLAARLEAQRAFIEPSTPRSGSGGMKGAADGMKLASEFVGGILVGAGLGYLVDLLIGTSPFGLVLFLILGFVAGVLNVLRSIGKTGAGDGQAPRPAENRENEPR